MPAWVRVHLPGVGTWSQREDVDLPEGAQILDGVDGLGLDGRPLQDTPEEPLDLPAEAAGRTAGHPTAPADAAATAATTPGDDQAGTPGNTRTKE